jgi:hypothetical protein
LAVAGTRPGSWSTPIGTAARRNLFSSSSHGCCSSASIGTAGGDADGHVERERRNRPLHEVAVRPVEDGEGHPARPVGVEVGAAGAQHRSNPRRAGSPAERETDRGVAQPRDRVVDGLDRSSRRPDRPEGAVGDALVQLVDARRRQTGA